MQNLVDIKKSETRESWMLASCDWLLDHVIMPVVTDHKKPEIKVSIGFPFRSSKAIGQCFTKSSSKGGFNEIFIHPRLNDTARILDILAHELIHAVDNCESGHRNFFAKTARAIGLEGKFTATTAGAELLERLNTLKDIVGDIPHQGLSTGKSPVKKQTTRMKKLKCGNCGFTARTSQKWLDMLEEKSTCPICNMDELAQE